MFETIGTLELKITRLEQHLELLKQRQQLSIAYPDHRLQLILEAGQVQSQLSQLKKYRDEILATPERLSHDTIKGQKPFYSVS
jgi:hypothetical protein